MTTSAGSISVASPCPNSSVGCESVPMEVQALIAALATVQADGCQ